MIHAIKYNKDPIAHATAIWLTSPYVFPLNYLNYIVFKSALNFFTYTSILTCMYNIVTRNLRLCIRGVLIGRRELSLNAMSHFL